VRVAKLLLADGTSQIYRAFHAMARSAQRPLSAPDGTPTGALLTFVEGMRKVLAQHAPDRVAVAFDRPEPTFRHERFPAYKAQRDAMPEDLAVQLRLAHDVLPAMGLRALEVPGIEADDIIATLARQARERGDDVVVVSSDKDLMQLVRPGTVMHHAQRDEVYDVPGVTKAFGVPPERVPDVLAIMGDASDNIPGVKGIGEVGAKQLVSLYGGLEEILAAAPRLAEDERLGRLRKRLGALLLEHAAEARLARELVVLKDDVALPVTLEDLDVRPPDRARCTELFTRLGFRRLLDELGDASSAAGLELASHATSGAAYGIVSTEADLEALCARLRAAGRFALDTETDGRDPQESSLVGIAACTAPGEAAYVPVRHVGGPNLDLDVVRRLLGPLLRDARVGKVGQNCKFDVEVLARHGMAVDGLVHDTMIASYLLDANRRSHDLDSLAADHLGYRTITYEDVAGRGDAQLTLDQVDAEAVARYSGEDADVALRLAQVFGPRIEAEGLGQVFHEIEMPLVPVLADMEATGVRVDPGVLRELGQQIQTRLTELTREIHALAGREFAINSPKQLAEVLFDDLHLQPRGRTAKTGARSTAIDVLEELASEHPLAERVMEHRELSKLKGTYLDVLPGLVHARTGRVHTSYNQSVAATGRLSSSDPNLQNIPIRTELGRQVRRAFVPGEGSVFVGADYSQVELRVMAHLSDDETLCAAFARGEDIHRRTASQVFGVALEAVTPELRSRAKEVNFGVLYGMTAHGLSQRLGITRTEAQGVIDRYFARMPRVQETVQRLIREVRESPRHEARTLFGRFRCLPDIVSKNQGQRSFAERAAVNTVVQGTAADLIKLAMIRLHARLRTEEPDAKMILQVHDELVVEAPRAAGERVRAIVVDAMENVYPLRTRLEVASSTGASWYDLK
jgi:DNA polymerase-1